MRPHRRRGPLEHVLVAGDGSDLVAMQALLSLLPATAYGQVFFATAAQDASVRLTAPPRVTVTRLDAATAAEVSDLLTAAVQGWLAEWMPEDDCDPRRAVTLWVGSSARERVDAAGATFERL